MRNQTRTSAVQLDAGSVLVDLDETPLRGLIALDDLEARVHLRLTPDREAQACVPTQFKAGGYASLVPRPRLSTEIVKLLRRPDVSIPHPEGSHHDSVSGLDVVAWRGEVGSLAAARPHEERALRGGRASEHAEGEDEVGEHLCASESEQCWGSRHELLRMDCYKRWIDGSRDPEAGQRTGKYRCPLLCVSAQRRVMTAHDLRRTQFTALLSVHWKLISMH